MILFLAISSVLLWCALLFVAFLLLGTMRTVALLQWQLEETKLTMPRRLDRDGLKPGKKAPAFTLPAVNGTQVSLADYQGRNVFLVFTQQNCGPCAGIVTKLERLVGDAAQTLIVNNGELEASRQWAEELGLKVPVLVQQDFAVSKQFKMFATPFAFLIDANGMIRSKGIAATPRHVGFILSGAHKPADVMEEADGQSAPGSGDRGASPNGLVAGGTTHD